MINQSRLPQVNPMSTRRLGKDDVSAIDAKETRPDAALDLANSGIAPLTNSPTTAGVALGGSNSFLQLLEQSKMDKPEVVTSKNERSPSAPLEQKSTQDSAEKKTKAEPTISRKNSKAKVKKGDANETSEQTLSNLLTTPKTDAKKEKTIVQTKGEKISDGKYADQNTSADSKSSLKQPDTTDNKSAAEALARAGMVGIGTQANALGQIVDAKGTVPEKIQTTNIAATAATAVTAATDDINSQGLSDDAGVSLQDVMQTLDAKLTKLQKAASDKNTPVGADQLSEIASKFDDVKFDFQTHDKVRLSENTDSSANASMTGAELNPEQDWMQQERALRSLLSKDTPAELKLNTQGTDFAGGREYALNLPTVSEPNQFNSETKALADNRIMPSADPTSTVKQPAKTFQDLLPDTKLKADIPAYEMATPQLMSETATFAQNAADGAKNSNGATQSNTATSSSLGGQAQTQVAGLKGLASLTGEQAGKSNNQQNTSSQNPQADNSLVGGVGAAKPDQTKGKFGDVKEGETKSLRNRESERTREIARSAALRAQSIASELAAKGGGTAKVQIKDSQLGVVELRINMSDNNRVHVELVANSDHIKKELEKQAEELKAGLEKHKVVLDGVRFATDTQLGDSGFQNSSQSDNSRANSQQQQQQSQQNSFSQNNNQSQQQNSNGRDRLFEGPQNIGTPSGAAAGSLRKNYSGKNDAQTNVQRTANGSLKVSA